MFNKRHFLNSFLHLSSTYKNIWSEFDYVVMCYIIYKFLTYEKVIATFPFFENRILLRGKKTSFLKMSYFLIIERLYCAIFLLVMYHDAFLSTCFQ